MNNMTSKKTKILLSEKSTKLAGKRTLLSYIRTSVVCISLAIGFIKLDKEHPFDFATITLFCFAGFFLIFGFIDYFLTVHYIKSLTENTIDE
ncbi:MAG: DUF202 domain-containing protein [Christensenellales bacterium]